jgi:hypothetical protein
VRRQYTRREHEWMLRDLRECPPRPGESIADLQARMVEVLRLHTGAMLWKKGQQPEAFVVRNLLAAAGLELVPGCSPRVQTREWR